MAGRSVLGWSLRALLDIDGLAGMVVAVSAEDRWYPQVPELGDGHVWTCSGGATRQDSVSAALAELLANGADPDDGVLVHDAARPGLAPERAQALIEAVDGDPNGGLLALPVGDTVKRADSSGHIESTVPREDLWTAQTPQLFRIGLLEQALAGAAEADQAVTDEASAMEAAGYRPLLVSGSRLNLKITYPADCQLVGAVLEARGAGDY